MGTDFLNMVRDVMVVGYLFVVRIGVPLLIILMYGAGMKKLLEPREDEPEATDAAQAPTVAK